MFDNIGVFFIAISFFIGGFAIGWKLGKSFGEMNNEKGGF